MLPVLVVVVVVPTTTGAPVCVVAVTTPVEDTLADTVCASDCVLNCGVASVKSMGNTTVLPTTVPRVRTVMLQY